MSVSNPVIASIDPSIKRIFLIAPESGEFSISYHPVDDIYKEMRNLRRLNESYRWFKNPVSAGGAIPKGSGKYTPRYAILNEGWRIVPFQSMTHIVYVTGEQLTAEGESGSACMDITLVDAGISTFIEYEPPAAEIIEVATGAVDPDEVADAIMNKVIEGTITLQQAQRLMIAILANKSSGGDTSNIKFRDLADSKNRVNETVDTNGNRLSVSLDLT